MKKQFFYLYILSFIIFTLLFGYSLVFSTGLTLKSDIKLISKIGNSVFIDSEKLNNFTVIFSSKSNLSKYSITSTCKIESKFIGKKDDKSIFNVLLKDKKCSDNEFYLKDDFGSDLVDTKFSIEFYRNDDVYSYFTDFNTDTLRNVKTDLVEKIKKLSIFKNYNGVINNDFEKYFYNKRLYDEIVYKKKIINLILESRKSKYISPVVGHTFPNIGHKNKLPNTGRPYREDYTIGIHQGWDIDAPIGTNLVALDDGVIVRIVDGFTKEDLNKIKYGTGLTYDEKVRNLDLLRGNQVWLKTSKGDVVFYSHLNEVYPNIQEGETVKAGQQLGTVGKTGVPGDDYEDYHLHFEVHKNPYDKKMAGKYDIEDYMKWDRYYKGKSLEYIAEHQSEIFDIK